MLIPLQAVNRRPDPADDPYLKDIHRSQELVREARKARHDAAAQRARARRLRQSTARREQGLLRVDR